MGRPLTLSPMPMIEFVGPSGDVIEQFHHTPVGKVVINGTVYKKAPIPSHAFGMHGFAREMAQEDEVKRDCYKNEQSGERWTCKYSKNQIRKVWGI